MTGRLEVPDVRPHHCDLPETCKELPGHDWPPLLEYLPEGSRFFCECGQVWVVHWRPDHIGLYCEIVGGPYWRQENVIERWGRRRRERRQGVPFDLQDTTSD